jgi:TPR repeat protein
MTSFEARAGTASDGIFKGEPAAQAQAKYAHDPAGNGDEEFRREQAKALSGDRDAMFRVAQMFRQGSNGVTRDEGRMVAWLRQASERDHKVASYQLYLHYVDRGLDRHAIHYEKLALRQGYVLPVRLDPRRG